MSTIEKDDKEPIPPKLDLYFRPHRLVWYAWESYQSACAERHDEKCYSPKAKAVVVIAEGSGVLVIPILDAEQ